MTVDEPSGPGNREASPADAPQRLGRYVVLGVLGRGGMGTVLDAFDPTLDRRVAIKVLHRELGERHGRRLLREARALARLSHPHVVQVYEADEVDGRLFIAMERVHGRTLRAWMDREPRPGWRQSVAVFLQAGAGLAAAHAQGLVHRDFKPGNAIVDAQGRARVLDFGLVRQVDHAGEEELARTGDEPDEREPEPDGPLTRTGMVLGTPAYMPLEQSRGREADARSDQFSFCVSLYEAVYGERPFEGTSLPALILSMTSGHVRPPPKGSTVPVRLRRVLLRGLVAAPAERWPSMDALLAELRRLVDPRTRRWLAVGVAAGLAVIGVGLARYAAVGFRCSGAADQLEGIWDETRRRELGAAIVGTGLEYAPDTWTRVEPALDEYASAWIAKHTEACEATRVTEEQTEAVLALRMACLGGRRNELRAVVEVLARADATRVEHAVELVASLSELARCDDAEALAAELPPPGDPELAARVEAERERLAEARALGEAGDDTAGRTLAASVLERAETLGYEPLVAEALQRTGRLRERVGQYAEAEAELRRAFLLAVRHGHGAVSLDASTALTFVVGDRRSQHEQGLLWGEIATELAEHQHAGARERASVLNAMGGVLIRQGDPRAALDRFQQAVDALEAEGGPHDVDLARPLVNAGGVLHELGRTDEALVYLRRGLAVMEEALGPQHPDVASPMSNIGNVLLQRGELESALAHHQRALSIRERALGLRNPKVAYSLASIGAVRIAQGRMGEAIADLRRALAIYEVTVDPQDPAIGRLLTNLGLALYGQAPVDEVLACYRRALAIFEAKHGPDGAVLSPVLLRIANVHHDQGRYAEALEHQQRALAITERALGSDHPEIASITNNAGNSLEALGRREEALASWRRALAIFEREPDPCRRVVVDLRVRIARGSLALRERTAAREQAELAISTCPDGDALLLAEARFVLARVLWPEPAERARGLELARAARDTYAERREHHERELAELDAWLAEHRTP